jgi:hypothetical protein
MPTVDEILGPRPSDGGFVNASAPPRDEESRSMESLLGPRPGGSAPVAQASIDPRQMDEILGPPPLHELERRFSNLDYTPTDYELGRYFELKDEKGLTPSEWPGKAAAAFGGLVEQATKAAKAVPGAVMDPGSGMQSLAEGVAQGSRDAMLLGKKIGEKLDIKIGPEAGRKQTKEEISEQRMAQWRANREDERQSARLASGEEALVPEVWGTADPDLAGGVAIVANPVNALPLGGGYVGKAANMLGRGTARALIGAGRASEVLGDVGIAGIEAVRAAPMKAAEAILGTGTEQAASLGPALGRVAGTLGAGAAGALGVASPPVFGAIAAAAAGAPVAKMVGQGLSAAGRNLLKSTYSAQLGLLGNIARDPAAAEWVRAAARSGRFADPALSAAGRAVTGAIEGAAVGGGLGALADGEEGFAAGVGIGAPLGAAGGIARGLSARERAARVATDLTRWKSEMAPEALPAIESMGLEQQARVMNAQRFISGAGDVDFHYLTADQWKEAGLAPGRALETTPGDRPQVYINATEIGNGTPVLHEIGHVLHRLFPEAAADLHRTLFSDFKPPGGTGTDFTTGRTNTSEGLMSPEKQQKLYDSYFTKLDPRMQAERRASWTQEDHLRSAREEIVGELISDLLTGKRPDYLHNLGGPLRRIADHLEQSTIGQFIGKVPGLDRFGERTQPGGSSLLTMDGQPLRLSAREAAALRGLLRVRDRTTRDVRVGDESRPVATVTQADMLGKHHKIISDLYGNSDTYKKNPDGSLHLQPDGRPTLLTENEVRKLNADRHGAIAKALGQTPQVSDTIVANGREIKPMRLQENGRSWEGDYFSPAQLDAIHRTVPGNLITPEQLRNIVRINEAIKTGEGVRLGVDHNTATKEVRGSGRRKYASQGSKFYEVVPYGFGVNKEGGLYFRAFDAGNLDRKLGRWMEGKGTKDQFAPWGGDRRAVEADIYKYLDNQRNGVPNSIGLDPNPVTAVQKRNVISDLLGATRGLPEVNPSQLSTKSGRDNHFKSFRVDRVNKITESGGKNLPVDYGKAKQNLMPLDRAAAGTAPLPRGVTPDAVIKHAEAQATQDFKNKLIAGGAPPALADEIASAGWKKAQQAAKRGGPAPSERALTVEAAGRLDQLGPADMEAIRSATLKGGTDGAAKEIEKRLLVKVPTVSANGLRGRGQGQPIQ